MRLTEFSDEDLLLLMKRLGSQRPRTDFEHARRGVRPLLTLCLALLSDGHEISDAEFLHRAYTTLVQRKASEQEHSAAVPALASAQITRAQIVQSLLSSPEYQRRLVRKQVPYQAKSRFVHFFHALVTDPLQRIRYPDRILPPLLMRHRVGEQMSDAYGRQFELTGHHFEAKLRKDAGLRTETRVLDLGAGCGRIAIPLTDRIQPPGYYLGLEAAKSMVRWCQRKLTPRFPNFSFLHCDVYNQAYNPRGKQRAETYHFPSDSKQFDLVIATSVFTHLLPEATRNYTRECARVLENGGKLFATFFLADNGTRSPDGHLDFSHALGPMAFTTAPSSPEKAVAYRLDWLLDVLEQSGLRLLPPVRWGAWTGRQSGYSWQDVLVLERAA